MDLEQLLLDAEQAMRDGDLDGARKYAQQFDAHDARADSVLVCWRHDLETKLSKREIFAEYTETVLSLKGDEL